MATAIFFNGRRINVPQAVSKLDASALAGVSPSAVGIVALVGEAEGGKPLTVDSEFSDHTQAGSIYTTYRSGDLRTASLFAFDPSTDDAIPGGAQRLVNVKVNPATQSVATLLDSAAADSVDLTSADWGLFTAQINVEVEAGTNQGKKITVVFEDETETFDDVGGDAIMDVLYAPGSNGYTAMTGQITSTQFIAAATKAIAGLDSQRASEVTLVGVLTVVSTDIGDTTQSLTVFGLDALNAPISETFALNGTTPVVGTTSFSQVTGALLSAAAAGTVTASDGTPTVLFSLAPAVLTRGLSLMTNAPAAGVLTLDLDSASAGANVVVRGLNAAGAAISERFDVAAGTPVVGTTTFAKITYLELGDLPAARTLTLTCNAAKTLHSTFKTVRKVVDSLNMLDGFTANALVSNATTFLMTDADYRAAVSLLTAADFYADIYFFVKKLNDSSQYVDAARASGASLPPDNTSAPVFLTGGSEGTTTITQWQQAFELLRKRRVNIIVPLSNDAAVHSLLASHLVERSGKLRSEANGYVGLGTTDGAGDTKSNIKSRIQALGTRHISAIAEEVQDYDPATGEATWFAPYFFAAKCAGMQAGSAIGEPLTRKRPRALDIRNDSSWTKEDDVEELIDAGLMMFEKVDGLGIRCIRSITTHLADDNVVYTEMSANESANTAVYELRTALEQKIGQRALAGSAAAVKGLASDVLGRLVDNEIIVAYRSLQVEQIGDVIVVGVEMAPVLPINFIPITVHLVALRIAA